MATLTLELNFEFSMEFRSSMESEAMATFMQPLRLATHLHTVRLRICRYTTAAQQAALLEGVVRGLAQPSADGVQCRTLQRVLLVGAQPDALAACRQALARDGIAVAVDTCH
jgi:hypothetical protein